jgi:hypothetical protein
LNLVIFENLVVLVFCNRIFVASDDSSESDDHDLEHQVNQVILVNLVIQVNRAAKHLELSMTTGYH